MNKILLIFLVVICSGAAANGDSDTSIDLLMKAELASTVLRIDDDQDYSFPLSSDSEDDPNYKSTSRAALYSLLIPGAGQYYIEGSSFKAKLFFGIEAGLWMSYFGFRKYGDFKESAAKGWAALHAGANPNNGDEEYWIKMTYYDNRDRNEDDGLGYNQMALVYDRDGALLFPETPLYYWNWDSRESRQKYRNLRNESKTAYERSDLSVGLVLANHIVSAIEAFFSASRHNRHIEFANSGFNLKYKIKASLDNPTFVVSLVKTF